MVEKNIKKVVLDLFVFLMLQVVKQLQPGNEILKNRTLTTIPDREKITKGEEGE